ncbi:hypothetical protein FRB99_007195, partial [Tulasnella sp. 403]
MSGIMSGISLNRKKTIKLDDNGRIINNSGSLCDVYKGYEKSTFGRVALKRYREDVTGAIEDRKKLRQIASALVYLHERKLIHGDIKAQNILISGSNDAKLCDFWLSKLDSTQTVAGQKGLGPLRFQSPERWVGEGRTTKSDVYAFGMTIYQVLSGQLPFFECQSHMDIYHRAVEEDERPPCLPEVGPTGKLYTPLWTIAERCWHKNPADRPTMRDVEQQLEVLPANGPGNGPALPIHRAIKHRGLTPPYLLLPVAQQIRQGTLSLPPPTTRAIGSSGPPPFHIQLLSRLAAISESKNVATGVADLGGMIIFDNPSSMFPHKMGGHCDIYRAVLPGQRAIAIKVLRACDITVSEQLERLAKRLAREMRVWKDLKHSRVTPLLGFAILEVGACLISPWCKNGNALEYIKACPTANRRTLILQVAEGLVYLHNHNPAIVHADIKACNILVSDDGDAMLCDFGLSKLLEDVPSGLTTESGQKGTTRWMAPEQLGKHPVYTTESDAYAFGCLALEIMTEKPPFVTCTHDPGVLRAKIQGELIDPADYPELPEDDPLWPLLRKCWAGDPKQRPSMNEIHDE